MWLVAGGVIAIALVVVATAWLLTRPDESRTPAGNISNNQQEDDSSTTGQLTLSFRPVLDLVQQSPALTDPKGDHPDDLDPATGLSDSDAVDAVIAYLPSEDDLLVYVVGPAFVTNSDVKNGRAQGSGPSGWVVVPEFTEEGGARFRLATGELAAYSVGSPQRRLAIVLNGAVISAPEIAAGVSPDEGLDPSLVVITIGSSDDPQAEAEALAAALRG